MAMMPTQNAPIAGNGNIGSQGAPQGPQMAPQGSQMPQQGSPTPLQLGSPQSVSGATGTTDVQQDPTQQAPSGNEQLARYRARRAAIYGEAQQTAAAKDPFAVAGNGVNGPVTQEQKQQTQKDIWLSKTAVAAPPTPTFQQKKHDHFMEHYNNDPAVKEMNDRGVWDVVNTMAEMVKRGDMSFDDALQQLQSDGFSSTVNEIIKRHHGDNKHSMVSHPMKTKRGNPERYAAPAPVDVGLTAQAPEVNNG